MMKLLYCGVKGVFTVFLRNINLRILRLERLERVEIFLGNPPK